MTEYCVMQLSQLLDTLGYQNSPNFLTGNRLSFDSEHGHLYRKAARTVDDGGCALRGVYSLRGDAFGESSQSAPIVYVCEAATEDEARRIHKRVWNQTIVPFLVVSSRRRVRLYSGFRYAPPDGNQEDGLLTQLLDDEVADALRAFSSQSIDDGIVWRDWGKHVSPETRVDWQLLRSLRDLDKELQSAGVSDLNVSHALIGTFVYLRYLRDRDILSDRKLEKWSIDPGSIFTRNATLKAFRDVLDRLQEWLNGEIFPIPENSQKGLRDKHIQLLAGTFYGDQPRTSQLTLFEVYDFSYIPIETLSVIYEQFLHEKPNASGRQQGAYYTPLPMVSFVVEKLNEKKPLRQGVRVFDPACGSGAFLVYAYRKLIEQEYARTKRVRPKLTELRELLTRHIFGVDIDADACSVAELSLILTLLDYADPPDLNANSSFKLPVLRDANIFQRDFLDQSAPWFHDAKYDWVVGNPPWKELRSHAVTPQDAATYEWIVANKALRPTGGNQVAEVFAWCAADVAKADGVVGLLLPAMTLFKQESHSFRQNFFRSNHLWAVANLSNLAEILFAGRSRVPAAAFFYSPGPMAAEDDSGSDLVEVYSPLVANRQTDLRGKRRKRGQSWNLVIDASEIRDVPYNRIVDGNSLSWKLAAWGSEADRQLLSSLEKLPTLGDLEDQGRLVISQGLELRTKDAEESVEYHPELIGKPMLDVEKLRRRGRIFSFPSEAISRLPQHRSYCRKGRYELPIKVCRPPHIVVSAALNFAVYRDDFLIVPPRQIGIAAQPEESLLLKALSLYLYSNFVLYHQFYVSAQFGVQMARLTPASLRKVPVPLGNLSKAELEGWEELYNRLLQGEGQDHGSRQHSEILRETNARAARALGLNRLKTSLVHDLVNTKFALRDGKAGQEAIAPPSRTDVDRYVTALRFHLDSFLGESSVMGHHITVTTGETHGVTEIDLRQGPQTRADDSFSTVDLSSLPRQLLERRSQWLYFQRNLRVYQGRKTYIFKPMQRFHWTRSQALEDAREIIAETLT